MVKIQYKSMNNVYLNDSEYLLMITIAINVFVNHTVYYISDNTVCTSVKTYLQLNDTQYVGYGT